MKPYHFLLVSVGAVAFFAAFNDSSAAIRRVPSQYGSIQRAIEAALDGDTVLVADGTYYENIRFMGKAITVASHYLIDMDARHIDSTVINGSRPASPDWGSTVLFINGEDTSSVLWGLTITGGTGSVNPSGYRVGGGIWIKAGSGARICHNRIISNNVSQLTFALGGGVSAGSPYQPGGWLILEDNEISRNTVTGSEGVGGAGVLCSLPARIQRNRIEGNEGFTGGSADDGAGISCWTDVQRGKKELLLCGNIITRNKFTSTGVDQYGQSGLAGGMSVVGYRGIVEHNVITENELEGPAALYGGGVLISDCNDSTEFRNNRISGNKLIGNGEQRGGGVCVWECSPKIYNNIITGNEGRMGGGVYVGGTASTGRPQMINNTICENQASSGCGLYADSSYPVVINSILWDQNQDTEVWQVGGQVTIAYSDVRGGWLDTGNINADPLLLPGDSMCNLMSSSPCIGRGIDSIQIGGVWYHAPTSDYDRTARPMPTETHPDMGAQEEQITVDVETQELVPLTYQLYQNYPNPFNPSTTIRYDLPSRSHVILTVFNTLGQQVATLVQGEREAGYHEVKFDASELASGVYLYRMQVRPLDSAIGRDSKSGAGEFVQTRKFVLLQ